MKMDFKDLIQKVGRREVPAHKKIVEIEVAGNTLDGTASKASLQLDGCMTWLAGAGSGCSAPVFLKTEPESVLTGHREGRRDSPVSASRNFVTFLETIE